MQNPINFLYSTWVLHAISYERRTLEGCHKKVRFNFDTLSSQFQQFSLRKFDILIVSQVINDVSGLSKKSEYYLKDRSLEKPESLNESLRYKALENKVFYFDFKNTSTVRLYTNYLFVLKYIAIGVLILIYFYSIFLSSEFLTGCMAGEGDTKARWSS